MICDSAVFDNANSRVDKRTVDREIERQSRLRPDQPAVVVTGYAPLSYRELQCLIDEIRTDLRGAGFGRSARIAVALPNGPHAALAIIAVACSTVAVPLNPKQTLDEIEMCLAVFASMPSSCFRAAIPPQGGRPNAKAWQLSRQFQQGKASSVSRSSYRKHDCRTS